MLIKNRALLSDSLLSLTLSLEANRRELSTTKSKRTEWARGRSRRWEGNGLLHKSIVGPMRRRVTDSHCCFEKKKGSWGKIM